MATADTGAAKVISTEVDLTATIAGTGPLYAGIIVASQRGSTKKARLIRSKSDYLKHYCSNNSLPVGCDMAQFSAINYLSKGNRLQVLRVAGAGALHAGALMDATVKLTGKVQDADGETSAKTSHSSLATGLVDPETYAFATGDTSTGLIYAKSCGVAGCRLSYAISEHRVDPKLRVITVYLDGVPVENFSFSRDQSYKDGMNANTYCEWVLAGSLYVGYLDNLAIPEEELPSVTKEPIKLGGGVEGLYPTSSDRIKALTKFYHRRTVPITIFLDGGEAHTEYHQAIVAMCEARQDCLAILSVPFEAGQAEDYVSAAIKYRQDTKIDSSYAALYFPHILGHDEFNDRKVWMSPDGFVGSRFAYTAEKTEMWYPVGGNDRGALTGAYDTQVHFDAVVVAGAARSVDMDELINHQINPILYTPERIKIWGQETMQQRKTHLSDIHVRMALIGMRPVVAQALEDFNFEFNDVDSRLLCYTMVDNHLKSLVGRKAFQDAYCVCNEDNNTAEALDSDTMNVDVYVKPKGYDKYINFRTILTPNSMSFSDATSLTNGGA